MYTTAIATLFVSFLPFATTATQGTAIGPELLTNPSFEQIGSKTDMPVGWRDGWSRDWGQCAGRAEIVRAAEIAEKPLGVTRVKLQVVLATPGRTRPGTHAPENDYLHLLLHEHQLHKVQSHVGHHIHSLFFLPLALLF